MLPRALAPRPLRPPAVRRVCTFALPARCANGRQPLLPAPPAALSLRSARRDLCSAAGAGNGEAAPPADRGSGGITLNLSAVPGAKHGGDKMLIAFTCKVCETRTARIMTKVRRGRMSPRREAELPRCRGLPDAGSVRPVIGWPGVLRRLALGL